jgi:hypothetical protein
MALTYSSGSTFPERQMGWMQRQRQSRTYGLLAIGTLVLAGCGGTPFESCESERIEVTMAATVVRGGATTHQEWLGSVAPSNLSGPGHYELVRTVVIEGGQSSGVIWTLSAFDTIPGYLAVALEGQPRAGDVMSVVRIEPAGGWGPFALPAGSRVAVNVVAGGFQASAVTGTIEVLQAAPLLLRLDLKVSNGAEESIEVAGDMRFELSRERVPCT